MAPVLQGDKLLGYAYLNSDFVNTTGYSGRPIHVLVGLGTDARVAGAKLVDHHEPIVLIGIPAERINRFIAGYVGQSVIELASQSSSSPPVDIVSGATVTVMVIGDSIVRSGRKVAQALNLAGAGAKAAQSRRVLDPSLGEDEDWPTLVGDGSIRRLALRVSEVNSAFERTGKSEAIARPEPGAPEEAFIDLYATLVSIPAIGRSLLGESEYQTLAQRLKPGQHALLIAGRGALLVQGLGLCPWRHLRPDLAGPGRHWHPVP